MKRTRYGYKVYCSALGKTLHVARRGGCFSLYMGGANDGDWEVTGGWLYNFYRFSDMKAKIDELQSGRGPAFERACKQLLKHHTGVQVVSRSDARARMTVALGNAAFEEGRQGEELARILEEAAANVRGFGWYENETPAQPVSFRLSDSNGNTVATLKLTFN